MRFRNMLDVYNDCTLKEVAALLLLWETTGVPLATRRRWCRGAFTYNGKPLTLTKATQLFAQYNDEYHRATGALVRLFLELGLWRGAPSRQD